MKASAVPAPGFFRRYALGMVLAGLLAGAIAGIILSTLEKPVFESTAVFRPMRMEAAPAEVSYRERLNTEAATLASQKHLEQVALRLNLLQEWQCSMDECVAMLKSRLRIAAVPDTELIRIVAQGPSAKECAPIANAIIAAREDQLPVSVRREVAQPAVRPEVAARISELSTKITALQKSAWQKKSELVAAIRAMNIPVSTYSGDDAINALTLPQLLADARAEWHAELALVETAKAELAASGAHARRSGVYSPVPLPYAEILESAVPSVNPVPREWMPRAAIWSTAGALAALVLCLLLSIEDRRSTPPDEPEPAKRQPLLAGEY
jgi:hypothetical protein